MNRAVLSDGIRIDADAYPGAVLQIGGDLRPDRYEHGLDRRPRAAMRKDL
jgi:hypothetical protein